MNFVFQNLGEYAPFHDREVTVFDECHTVSDVLQNMFSIDIVNNFEYRLSKIQDSLLYVTSKNNFEIISRANELKNHIIDISEDLFNEDLALIDTLAVLENVAIKLKEYCMIAETCIKQKEEETLDRENVSFEQKVLKRNLDKIYTLYATIEYFITTNKGIEEWVVKKHENTSLKKKLTVQTLKDELLFKRHVHKYCRFKLWMSATIGNIPMFAKNSGIEDYEYGYMQSDFKFDKSPIHKVEPFISLGSKDKAISTPILMERMLAICEKLHPQERGIIHTGNYEISKKFEEYVKQNSNNRYRYLFYNGSAEKEEVLKQLSKSSNGIIIGPSLMEGLDLKDDLSRFCILAKVPYPILDIFNQKRLKLIPGWYDWKTFTSFLQSIGRPIRHKDDWATTYLMDSCFNLLFNKCDLQPYIKNRIDKWNINDILNPVNLSDLFDY